MGRGVGDQGGPHVPVSWLGEVLPCLRPAAGVLPSLQARRRRQHAHREGVQRDYVSHALR